MRALFGVADEPGTVERGGCGDVLGKARRGRQGIGAAHAIAVTSDFPLLYLPLPVDRIQHRGNVFHDRGNSHLGADRPHAVALGAALFEHAWPENRVAAGAVIEGGQQHVIADSGRPARHVAEFFADALYATRVAGRCAPARLLSFLAFVADSHRQAIGFRRGAVEQGGLLVGGIAGGDPLERVPPNLITAGTLVDREIALEHAALRAERSDAGLDIGAPSLLEILRRRRLLVVEERVTDGLHPEPAELDIGIGKARDFADPVAPFGEGLLALAGIRSDGGGPAAMLEPPRR